jgi:urate oxidase
MTHKTEKRQDGDGNVVSEQKYNHLVSAEMMKEDNYNQIDGVLNNTTPTFWERMKEAKTKAKEHNSRKSERHKQAKRNRKSERHRNDRHENSSD